MTVEITYDKNLIWEIAARFDLREPNRLALDAVVRAIADADGEFRELVADLATGVGKTFLMSALIEYLASQGVRHVLVVTPGSTIQRKTLANFDAASSKYVPGADMEPTVITPDNFQAAAVGTALRNPAALKVFVFNVQQLIRPTDKVSRRVRATDENIGDALYAYLEGAGDLFVIADEHHIYREKAKAFFAAIRDLDPVSLIGLTATPDKSDYDKVVFQYTLGDAIADGHVKVPVIVYRKDGTKDDRTQLRDACQLLGAKESAYRQHRVATPDVADVKPVLFVVCGSIDHATQVGQLLAQPGLIGDPGAILEITSQSSDEALKTLAEVESADSPIRAIVSVNMLREGWDVKNIAVIVALRKLASQTLTEQILGRGLRLPFGQRTGFAAVDQVDLVAHDSYRQLLDQKDVLRQRLQMPPTVVDVDEHGASTSTDPLPERTAGANLDPGASVARTHEWPSSSGTLLDGLETAEEAEEAASEDESAIGPSLLFRETEGRIAAPEPEVRGRVDGAPQIEFPRRKRRLANATFSLSDVADGDAEAAGARFIREVPTFIYRDALEATRKDGEVTITVAPQSHTEAEQTLTSLDVVRENLTAAIMTQPEVPQERASKNAARRLVNAFLKGAGVTSDVATAEWGDLRRQQAIDGMRTLIRAAITSRPQEVKYSLVSVTLPVEPVPVPADAKNAYNDKFIKHTPFVGWQKNIMPLASFDAGSTEWEIAHLLDRDDEITWWARLYVDGRAFIPTQDGPYYPDFIAIDGEGTNWVIEGKGDKYAQDADVLTKRDAANQWARAVRDDDRYGTWRYMFATESQIKQSAGSWNGLRTATNPE